MSKKMFAILTLVLLLIGGTAEARQQTRMTSRVISEPSWSWSWDAWPWSALLVHVVTTLSPKGGSSADPNGVPAPAPDSTTQTDGGAGADPDGKP